MRRLSPTTLGTQLTPHPGSYHSVREPFGLLTLRLSSYILPDCAFPLMLFDILKSILILLHYIGTSPSDSQRVPSLPLFSCVLYPQRVGSCPKIADAEGGGWLGRFIAFYYLRCASTEPISPWYHFMDSHPSQNLSVVFSPLPNLQIFNLISILSKTRLCTRIGQPIIKLWMLTHSRPSVH